MAVAVTRSGNCGGSHGDRWCLERACQSGSHGNAEARRLFSPWAMSQGLYWALRNFGIATGFYIKMKIPVYTSLVYTNAPSSFICNSQKLKTAQKLKTTQMSINRWQIECYSSMHIGCT